MVVLLRVRALAEQYDTSQSTVKVALAILRARGIVRGHQGKATYVAEVQAQGPA